MDAAIKIGGSLSDNPKVLRALGEVLCNMAKWHPLVVVPGGGRFADAVRKFDAVYGLPAATSHKMAILAMDLYGLILSNIIPGACSCDSLAEAETLSREGKVAVLLPSKLLLQENPFEPSWDVTSDSITAFIAVKLHAPKAVFATDVDGVFSADPKKKGDAKFFETIHLDELLKLRERTSVDSFLPRFLIKNPLDCYVVNGLHPERVEAVLSGKRSICTRIISGE